MEGIIMTTHYVPDPIKPPKKRRPDAPRVRSLKEHVKVVGLTFREAYPDNILENYPDFPNADVELVREPANPHDKNAISVWAVPHNGDEEEYQIGFLPKERAAALAPKMDSGTEIKVIAAAVMVHPDNPDHPGVELVLRYS